ncbi:MAG: tyrosine recombinase [Calditrichaeota bacterium]|nr:MAG: tyrosine recombinase [Calditrichota bacterium]MBL1207121.1 tyrosine recombinase [Calditrichota bacterium]NOG46951.1 tyrosine recombinase [Calditrichota bacterium]
MDKTVRSYLRYLALEKRYSPQTVKSYSTDLSQFSDFLSELSDGYDIAWKNINKKNIRHFLMELQDRGLGKRSIARKVATLKSYFQYLEKQEVIINSLASSIKMPRFDQKLPEFLSDEEIKDILNKPDLESFEGLRDRAILELFYSCGLRLAELINLKLEDLMLRENAIRVLGKGKKERIIPIGKHAKKAILNYLDKRQKKAQVGIQELFVLGSGKKMYAMAIQRLVKKHINEVVNVHTASPHILRHSYATHLLDEGANIRVVKDLLGHQNLSTTQVYTHLSIEHLQRVYKKAHPKADKKE